MTRNQAFATFRDYLKNNGIKYNEYLENGKLNLLMLYHYDKCPDHILESSVSFYETGMEVRVYYSENSSGWIRERVDNLSNLYRVLNFLNARIWKFTNDCAGGTVYSPRHLYTPRFYITEDSHYDLTATLMIDYEHFSLAPLETEDYCTIMLPQIMAELSLPMFFLLMEEISVEEAIFSIKKDILKEDA